VFDKVAPEGTLIVKEFDVPVLVAVGAENIPVEEDN
jgi:hypothetical protein